MRWLERLADELAVLGVRGRERRRILLELHDHIECDPGCEDRLGAPRELAASFADELATDRARRSAFNAFGALAIAAAALIVSQLAIGHAGGYPGFTNGLSVVLFMPAAIGILIAPQVALVAGTLATLRAVRRRRARVLPAAEIALIRRRAWVGLGAGFATVAGLELYVVDFSSVLPAWWLALVGGLAAVAGVTLLGASRTLARAGAVVSGTSGQAGDIYEDLPLTRWQWLRRRPWRVGMIASLTVAIVMTLFQAHAEHSLIEGIQRGLFEGLAAAVGFALLGGAVGVRPPSLRIKERALRRSAPMRAEPDAGARLILSPSDQLVADEDRSRAELVLRENFGHGRLTLEELTTRVAAVHDALTIGQLHAALSGLPDGP
ncbi:MAG: DUF1707 domain-containing protein [Solirubrobacteraceae bacterium]